MAKANLLASGIDIRLDSEANYMGREFDEKGRLLTISSEKLKNSELLPSKKNIF